YGRVVEGMETSSLVNAMNKIDMPDKGVVYKPGIDSLEAEDIYSALQDSLFGGMPVQIGMCWGYNTKLNCLEYHRNSEINIGAEDFILLVARQEEITDGVLDTACVKAFKAPKGAIVEVYATTLHYAPCQASKEKGFRTAIVLPLGTNTEKPAFIPSNEEDKWMTARNKWLLAHEDSDEARGGAHIGLKGINIDIKEDI
ncbi:MAG: DUF4867 family protein, partial [Parasporobacterium sp.]|nr:DUF4867 family protein [Parasporobacterium sp.]